MNTMHRSMTLAGAAVVTSLLLGGCAQGSAPPEELTLLQTKLPAQLLRNDVASQIDPAVVASVGDAVDQSIACLTEKEDPKGLQRSWQSIVTVLLVDASAKDVDSIIDGAAAVLTEQGWKLASLGGSAVIHTRYLSNDSSSTIELSAISDDEDAQYVDSSQLENASIVVEVHGPCVATDGTDSDEVTSLEGS
jgi:hypothetical protein